MQLFLYLIVGGLSFLVEIATFLALRQAALSVILASVTSFAVATVTNYFLSILLAFQHGRFGRRVELVRFLGVVMVGLGLNTALVWCFAYPLAIPPTLAKIAVVPIVLIWNYLARRMLVFSNRVPVPVQSLLAVGRRALERAFSNLRFANRLQRTVNSRASGPRVMTETKDSSASRFRDEDPINRLDVRRRHAR